jgi:hypothetical protein
MNIFVGLVTRFERLALPGFIRIWCGALPHQLVKLRGRDLSITVQNHRERLLSRWSLTKIDLIEQQFDSLLVSYQSEEAFKNALENCGAATGFKEGWWSLS